MLKKRDQKKTQILNLISNTFENSSIHAIPNIVRNESYLIKIIWIIFLLGSTGYCAYLVYQSVMNYLSFDVVSLNRIYPKKEVQFPTVTICNVNPFTTSFSKQFMENLLNDSLYENKNPKESHKLNLFYKRYTAGLTSIDLNETTQTKFGYSLNETLLSCVYNYADCSIEKDFQQYYNYFFGNCMQFNSNQTKTQIVSGSSNGLQLELFIDLTNDNNSMFSMNDGFRILISDNNNLKTYYSEGIKAPLGFSTDIILNRYLIEKKPYPYSECKSLETIDSYNSRYFKKTFEYLNQSYREYMCKQICFQDSLIQKCNCVDLTAGPSPDPSLKQCLNVTNRACSYAVWQEYLEKKLYDNCDCPLECNKNFYIYTTSFINFPSEPYVNYLLSYPNIKSKFRSQQNLSYEYLKNRLASINIFYDDISETVIKEDAKMLLPDLISNVGGILGLFLGNLSYKKLIKFLFYVLNFYIYSRNELFEFY